MAAVSMLGVALLSLPQLLMKDLSCSACWLLAMSSVKLLWYEGKDLKKGKRCLLKGLKGQDVRRT